MRARTLDDLLTRPDCATVANVTGRKVTFPKPLIVYVGGTIADEREQSLGHAGAVLEGRGTSARDKIALFDEYLSTAPYTFGMQ